MVKTIKTEQEYELALERAYALMQKDLKLNTKEADELDLITLLIEHYEEAHYPISPPSPIEAIKFRLEQMGKSSSELSSHFPIIFLAPCSFIFTPCSLLFHLQ